MTNELVNYQAVNMTAKSFVDSGLFKDTATQAQAVVKILAGREFGLSPFQAMSALNVIKGKVVLTSGFLASKIKSSGIFDYKIKDFSDKICSIDFFKYSQFIGNFTFTIEDARRAGTGSADNGAGKMIDKFPKNMLFARAISNGVKFYIPDLFSNSVYVEGELDGVLESENDNIYDVDVKAFFVSKFPVFYQSWELLSTIEQMNNAIEKMNLDDKWKRIVSLPEFQRLKELKIKEIQETVEDVEAKESYLTEALLAVDKSTSLSELEIHEKTYAGLLVGDDKAFFEEKVNEKRYLLPKEEKVFTVKSKGGIPVFDTEITDNSLNVALQNTGLPVNHSVIIDSIPEIKNEINPGLSPDDLEKESLAISEIDKCEKISDIQEVVKKYNGLKSRSAKYAKSIENKVNIVAESLFHEFKAKALNCRNERQLLGVRKAYPSFDNYPEWSSKFDLVVKERMTAFWKMIEVV